MKWTQQDYKDNLQNPIPPGTTVAKGGLRGVVRSSWLKKRGGRIVPKMCIRWGGESSNYHQDLYLDQVEVIPTEEFPEVYGDVWAPAPHWKRT